MNKIVYRILLLVICSMLLMLNAMAVDITIGTISAEVRILQSRLAELGFFSNAVSGEFDIPTQVAVDEFAKQHGLPIFDGVSREIYEQIMSPIAQNRVTETDRKVPLFPGSQNDSVVKLQIALLSGGYFDRDFTAGFYDPPTQYAQDKFCEQYGIVKQSGATEYMQELIINTIQRNRQGESSTNASSDILTQKVSLFGIKAPALLYFIVAILMIVLITLVLVNVFMNRQNKTNVNAQGEVVDLKKGASSKKNHIKFNIQYDNCTRTEEFDINASLSIGRAPGGLVLDQNDRGISRQHCVLYLQDNQLFLKDKSQIGTFVNGSLVHQAQKNIAKGDILKIGNHIIKIE